MTTAAATVVSPTSTSPMHATPSPMVAAVAALNNDASSRWTRAAGRSNNPLSSISHTDIATSESTAITPSRAGESATARSQMFE